MGRMEVKYTQNGISNIPHDKPIVFKIKTGSGRVNYANAADRYKTHREIEKHLGKIPGKKVEIEQFERIKLAREKINRLFRRKTPKYNILEHEEQKKTMLELRLLAISLMSHSLRTKGHVPLIAMSTVLEILNNKTKTTKKHHEIVLDRKTIKELENIKKQIEKIIEQVRDILDISLFEKTELFQKKRVSVNDIMALSLKDCIDIAKKNNVQIIINKSPNNLFVLGHDELIAQAIENYIINAIKFTADNGMVQINCKKQNRKTVVSITDNGLGLTSNSKLKKRINAKFTSSRVGLSLSKTIIELHGGNVKLISPVNPSDFPELKFDKKYRKGTSVLIEL